VFGLDDRQAVRSALALDRFAKHHIASAILNAQK
jgi:hypothetical protein